MTWGLDDMGYFISNTQQQLHLDPIVIDGMAVFDISMLVVLVVGLVVAYGSRFEIVKAGPRIMRMVLWGGRSAYRYKRFNLYYRWKYSSHPSFDEMYQEGMSKMHRQVAHGLLRVCQKNGGVYVKAGQTAASLTTLPPEYREMLQKLEDSVPPRPFVAIKKALEVELGHKVEDVFEAFESRATAAASLAQVHKARLKDGTDVAVKIQYPGLESALHADLAAMTLLAGFATLVFRVSDWRWFLREIREKLSEELDFRNEADNAARLAICFAERDDIVVPRLFPRWSSKRLLCMEWIQGIKVSDKEELKKAGLSPRQVALLFQGIAAEMMCSHGFVHGDMHPGNVFVRALPPSSNILTPWRRHPRPQLVLIDHGLYFNLPSDMRLLYCMMWCAFVLNDAATATTAAVQLAGETTGRVLPAMLKPRDWDTMTPEERLKARNKVGFGGMQDIRNAMKSCPQDLADCLRAMTIVRHTCSRLGTNIADRLRVNAVEALKGLKVKTQNNKRVEYVGVMKSRMKRWRLWLHIAAMKLAAWIVLIAGGIHQEEDEGKQKLVEEGEGKQKSQEDDATSASTKNGSNKTFHIQVMPA